MSSAVNPVDDNPVNEGLLLGLYGTEPLPDTVRTFKRTETRRYRDAVCYAFNLHYKQIEGEGDCFFASCSAAFKYVHHVAGGNEVPSQLMRNLCCTWLRRCVREEGLELHLLPELTITSPGIPIPSAFRREVVKSMQAVLKFQVVGAKTKTGKALPSSICHYLEISENQGVWVEGFHWLYAVAWLYNVCIVVIVNGHEFTHVYGNRNSIRIYLYKFNAETHYDVLLPCEVPFTSPVTKDAKPVFVVDETTSSSSSEISSSSNNSDSNSDSDSKGGSSSPKASKKTPSVASKADPAASKGKPAAWSTTTKPAYKSKGVGHCPASPRIHFGPGYAYDDYPPTARAPPPPPDSDSESDSSPMVASVATKTPRAAETSTLSDVVNLDEDGVCSLVVFGVV